MTEPAARCWRIPAHISVAQTEYGSILLDEQRGHYYQLNATAALVVDGLVEGAPPTVIVERLADEYDVSAEQAGADVAELTVALERSGTLVPDDGPGRARR